MRFKKIYFTLVLIILPATHAWALSEQIEWLKAQQDLNATRLVDSYEGDGTDRAYTYDQALAIIAFSEAGEPARARMIIDKMEDLQDSSGRWYEGYDAANPLIVPGGCQLYKTGEIAWMVIAINFYEAKTEDPNHASVAQKALGWLDTMMNTEPSDEEYGSIRYCSGPDCGIPDVISTEHNHDAYSAYYWRGILDSNNAYIEKANLILSYLSRETWGPSAESNCEYDSKVFWRGFNDCAWCTDCQSWGVLSLGPIGPEDEQFYEALDWLWYSPWGNTRNQQDYNDVIIDVDGFKSCTGDVDYIWLECTEGAAAAYYSICDNSKGDYFHSQTQRVISPNGGVPHTFTDTDPETIRWPENWRLNSVASTSWYYFNERRINPFDIRDACQCYAASIDGVDPVNFTDFSMLAPDWQQTGLGLTGDLDKDCFINAKDLAIIAEYWLENCN